MCASRTKRHVQNVADAVLLEARHDEPERPAHVLHLEVVAAARGRHGPQLLVEEWPTSLAFGPQ
jgi:hypothetical protein